MKSRSKIAFVHSALCAAAASALAGTATSQNLALPATAAAPAASFTYKPNDQTLSDVELYQAELLGWQLAATMHNATDADDKTGFYANCDHDAGASYAARAEAMCDVRCVEAFESNACGGDWDLQNPTLDPYYFASMTDKFQTFIFTAALLNAGDPKTGFYDEMCTLLNLDLLNQMHLTDYSNVEANPKKAICMYALRPNMPPSSDATLPDNVNPAIAAFTAHVFGDFVTGIARNQSELADICANFPKWRPILTNPQLRMDYIEAEAAVCNGRTALPYPTPQEAVQAYQADWTELFLTQLISASQLDGYKKYLCNNLNATMMNAVGLVGDMVVQGACTL